MSRLFSLFLDILFPKKPLVRELEHMDAMEFAAQVRGKGEVGRAGKNILSCCAYQHPLVRQAVFELKYRGNKKVARLLGTLLYDELMGFLEEYASITNFRDPILMPIPLSRKRESERGFNQCKLLVDILCELDGQRNFTTSFALTKERDTESQTKTDTRKRRLLNLKGCFAVSPGVVLGRNIILIDDVATTGATLEEAQKTLLRAGARKVIAFTVAH